MTVNIGFSPEPVQGGDITSLSGQKEAVNWSRKSKAKFLYSREPNKHKLVPPELPQARLVQFMIRFPLDSNVQPEDGY